jgi:ABC-type nickel/cobalt efflux system permease component RcnA
MDVIPLTLAISLLLSLTFIALFVREFSRPRRAGADRDSLLPLENDLSSAAVPAAPAAAASSHTHAHSHSHAHPHSHAPFGDDVCASKRTDGKCCSSCQRRKDRVAAKAASASVPST